jgi:hypothetical protein
VDYMCARSHYIRNDDLMSLYYCNRNQRITTVRSSLIISAGFDELDAGPPAPTRIHHPTASILEGWSGAVIADRTGCITILIRNHEGMETLVCRVLGSTASYTGWRTDYPI